MADILADTREDASLTEAQILAGNTKSGQSFHASDTKRNIFWSNVNSKYYRDDIAEWSGSAWVGGKDETAGTPVTDPATETISGSATTQQGANTESKSAIESNTESILNLAGASMKIAEFGGTFATTEVMFNFDTITASDNTDLLNADDTTNIVSLKKPLRYQFQTYVSVITTGNGSKVLTLRVYNNADDTLLSTRNVDINGGINNDQSFPLDTVFIDNPIENLEIYFTAQCTDTEVDLVELNTTIVTGGGGGGGIWDIQDGEIVNVGSRPVSVNVITSGIGDLTVTGTGTAYDSTYSDTSNPDSFGNPTLSDGVNTVIKDDANAFWCLVAGITTTNPAFGTTQYANFTGSIEGVYTVVLGAGVDGSATIANGGGGSHAITANSDIIAPVFEVTGKAARRYDFESGYIVDTIIEPEAGAAYVILTNGVPREATPVSGVGKAKNLYRSLFLGGETTSDPNLDTDIANTDYDATFIPCNTDATGADLGVSGSAQIVKALLIGELQASGERFLITPEGASNAKSTNDIPEREALGPKGFIAREDLTERTFTVSTAATGFTIDVTNPLSSALTIDGDTVTKGRVSPDSGTIDTSSDVTLCNVILAHRPTTTAWGLCTIFTTTGAHLITAYITSSGDLVIPAELNSATYTVNFVVVENIFIKNR